MTAFPARLAALTCSYWMWKKQFYPRTILNIGLSSGPEIIIWKWQFPKARIVAVDPRGRDHVVDRLVRAVVHDGSSETTPFCYRCLSTNCLAPHHHRRRTVSIASVSIDQLAADEQPPYFIWMDIEGGEMPALKGAAKTLEQTPFLNIETRDWGNRSGQVIKDFMAANRYGMRYQHHNCSDVLYYNRRRIVSNWDEMHDGELSECVGGAA